MYLEKISSVFHVDSLFDHRGFNCSSSFHMEEHFVSCRWDIDSKRNTFLKEDKVCKEMILPRVLMEKKKRFCLLKNRQERRRGKHLSTGCVHIQSDGIQPKVIYEDFWTSISWVILWNIGGYWIMSNLEQTGSCLVEHCSWLVG